MTTKRHLTLSAGAYAVLTELKRGDAKWDVDKMPNGNVCFLVDSEAYDQLLEVQRENGLSDLSQTITWLYRTHQEGAPIPDPPPLNTGDEQC